jgi:endoglucanase
VRDFNTATDGELAIAWALLRAAERWNVPEWRARAITMSRDILATSVQEANGRLFLLPGAFGFNKSDRLILNPSYYNFPAIRALASASEDPRWINIDDNGLWLLEQARFGKRGLSPDWVEMMKVSAEVLPPSDGKLMFSWDAIRVPLFLAWVGENAAPALTAAADFWTSKDGRWFPAWTNLRTGSLAPYAGHAGIIAVARLTLGAVALKSGDQGNAAEMPTQATAPDYYAGALALLSRMAWQESRATQHHAKPPAMS